MTNRSNMSSADRLSGVPGATMRALTALRVSGPAYDSRQVRPGDMLYALPARSVDGSRFIEIAFGAGAVTVVGQSREGSGGALRGSARCEAGAGGAPIPRRSE